MKIVELPKKKPKINQDAIEIVRGTLDRLLSGQVSAVAIVEVTNENSVATVYSHTGNYHQLNSGCARLAARIATER